MLCFHTFSQVKLPAICSRLLNFWLDQALQLHPLSCVEELVELLLLHLHFPIVNEVEEECQLHLGDGEGQWEGGGGVGGDKVGQEGGGGSQDEPVAGNLQQKY